MPINRKQYILTAFFCFHGLLLYRLSDLTDFILIVGSGSHYRDVLIKIDFSNKHPRRFRTIYKRDIGNTNSITDFNNLFFLYLLYIRYIIGNTLHELSGCPFVWYLLSVII